MDLKRGSPTGPEGPDPAQRGEDGSGYPLLEALICAHRPAAILEVSGRRCLTADWLAEAYDGPVHVFNVNPDDHPNAKRQLSGRPNVHVNDAGHVLFDIGRSGIAGDRIIAIIGWDESAITRLRDIVRHISRHFGDAVLVFCDFPLPDADAGSAPGELGQMSGIRALFGLFPDESRICLSHPAPDVGGPAHRGFCVVGAHAWLGDMPLLRAGDYHGWLAIECAQGQASEHVIGALQADIASIAVDSRARIQGLMADLVAKEQVIQELSAALKATASRLEHELAGRDAPAAI